VKSARQVLTEMGIEFNHLREKNKTQAWKTYQRRLNENAGQLCEIMSMKDIVELSMRIESEIKSESGGTSGSALDEVRGFLSDDAKPN